MKVQRFEVSNTPHLTLTCYSDLDIRGGREGEVVIKAYGPEEDLKIEREGERLSITAHVRCKIGCPKGATITIPAAHGSLRVQQVDGPIAVEMVGGDTVLKEVGPTTITTASGSVRARSVGGDLRLDQVGGDLTVRGVEGFLSSDTVGGSLRASHLEGGLQATIGGDGSLTTDFTPGCDYKLSAGGQIVVKFPEQASARIQADAGGTITDKVEWAEVQKDSGTLTGRVGAGDEGEANVEINAGGDVSLRSKSDSKGFSFSFVLDDDLDLELESMAEEIERNIEAHMARMNAQLEAQLSRIDHEAVREKAERAAEKVRRRAERAAERARLKAERAQRRWERMGGSRRPHRPPSPPSPPARRRAADPITEEERMMILKMVQEGKISAEEGTRLLEAMEG
jgi:hypothetical protein